MSSILFMMVVSRYLRKIAIWFIYYLLLGIKPREIARHIEPDSRCLDVGAGVGQYTLALRKMGFKVWPLEPDRDKLVRCDVELAYCATAQNIPTQDGHFDLAFAINVLHHTRARKEMLVEMIRVSDRVLISELNRDNLLVRIYNKIIGESPDQLLNESELRALMLRAGIGRVKTYQRGLFGVPNVFIYASGEEVVA